MRAAARFGAVRLERIAERGRREERLAALRGIAVVEDGWYTLPELVRPSPKRSDADVAEAAALAVRPIAAGLSPQAMFADEVPRDVPARAAVALLDIARRAELRPSLRVAAVGALASLRAVTKIDEAGLGRLVADPEPQLRRAAVEGLAGAAAGEAPLVRALEEDSAVEVAAAAGAALCRDLPLTGNRGPAVERAARLTPRARERLRSLALDEKLALVDRLDLLGCLRAAAQPPDQKLLDQKVLDQLARAKIDSVRRRARSLGGR